MERLVGDISKSSQFILPTIGGVDDPKSNISQFILPTIGVDVWCLRGDAAANAGANNKTREQYSNLTMMLLIDASTSSTFEEWIRAKSISFGNKCT